MERAFRPERGSASEAGALKQKAPISDVRESRAVTQVQRREDVNCIRTYANIAESRDDTKSGIDIPVISHPIETLHARSLQGFRGLLKTGAFNPDLVSIKIWLKSRPQLRYDRK